MIQPSASIGIAVTDSPRSTSDELISHADTAMYAAKHAGRGAFRVFDASAYAEERARASSRAELTAGLREGLRAGQIEVHYQPIVELHDAVGAADALGVDTGGSTRLSGVWAVEALARWRHPALGLLTAAHFLPLAEADGLVVELGALVLRRACAQLAAWDLELGVGSPARLFVNLSATELAQHELVDVVADALAHAGLAPGRLTLEITETELFTEPVVVARAIEGLRRLGCELAIDDFGTGYSSLSRLVEIPAATLKVDQSFTQALATRAEANAVVSSVLLLGQRLHRTVVVEGVEDADTLRALRRLGVTHAQGYHLGRPQPATVLSGLLGLPPSADGSTPALAGGELLARGAGEDR